MIPGYVAIPKLCELLGVREPVQKIVIEADVLQNVVCVYIKKMLTSEEFEAMTTGNLDGADVYEVDEVSVDDRGEVK